MPADGKIALRELLAALAQENAGHSKCCNRDELHSRSPN
jgi:hypothetical protein